MVLNEKKERIRHVIQRLRKAYPDAECSLTFRNPYELLVATILSAQCTDARVNQVTPKLFERFPTVEALAQASLPELEKLIQSTGFFRNKAKNLKGMATAVVSDHEGLIPDEMEALHRLPGVGRKTANVVLGNAFGKADGVVVDTHVKRLSFRLGFTSKKDPEKVEKDLNSLVPVDDWVDFPHLLIQHGREICDARRPLCSACILNDLCPKKGVLKKFAQPSEMNGGERLKLRGQSSKVKP